MYNWSTKHPDQKSTLQSGGSHTLEVPYSDARELLGDVLRFDAERLRILVERHHLHTGSARARELLEDWDNALKGFIKVMPRDYKRALLQAHERAAAKAVAAE